MINGLETYKVRWNIVSDNVIKPGLEAITKALYFLGNPQENLPIVHLAGTNGKGSTLTFIESMASEHGLKVGKFMSPCIIDIHDQIQVAGLPVSEQQLDVIFQDLQQAQLSGCLTDFELLTVAAFMHFQRQQVDLVLLEAGMGGLLDSTNVIKPIVSVIPSIDLEHTNFLGTTLAEIAAHKAGIIKEGRPVVVGRMTSEALDVIKQQALSQKAPLLLLGNAFDVKQNGLFETYMNSEKAIEIAELCRRMVGPHQARNMALAITAFLEVATALQLHADTEAIRRGIARASLPGRFEEVLPNVYFDGAHNPASALTLVTTIQEQFLNKKIRFIVGMLADKDVQSVLRILEQVSDDFLFVDFDNSRAMRAQEILTISRAKQKSIAIDALEYIQKLTATDGVTVVTGSLYLLAGLRRRLLHD